ncbi:NUDIX hydrolase [Candidatus Parcubacteria bacterium]|nr:NUDIX hydrolase [Candidatus Parcubacteria bacterium]
MNFKIAVKGIIRRGDGKILIVKRSSQDSFMPGIWETVGGGVKEKDNPKKALEREIMEEVGLTVRIGEPFNVFTFNNNKGEFKIGITFVCDYLGGEIKLSSEHSDFKWIDPTIIKQFYSIPLFYNEITAYSNKYSADYERFTVSQKAVIIRDDKCFVAEINKTPGIWDLPGGRIDRREDAEKAFRREIKEEIGVSDFEILATYDCDTWLSPVGAAVYGSVSLISTDKKIVLSTEHAQCKWINKSEIDDYNYIWPAMNRMIKKGFWYYGLLRGGD